MAVEASLPTLVTVLVTAAIDSINPCAIGVMILLVALMVSNQQLRGKMLFYGGLYVFSVFLTYLLAGLGIMAFLASIPLFIAQYISVAVGGVIVLGGIVEIKDFFWYGKGISLAIPPERAKDIKKYMRNLSAWGVIFLGAFVAGVELPCTGGPYLAILLVLKQSFDLTAVLLLVLYNIIFVAPLIAILAAAMVGVKISDMQMWKQANKANMRLGIGILLVFLGWLLILIANGTINLG
ncbi:MAG: GAP family protein [Candidatus Micrarchaeota archaeon]